LVGSKSVNDAHESSGIHRRGRSVRDRAVAMQRSVGCVRSMVVESSLRLSDEREEVKKVVKKQAMNWRMIQVRL
jgi:hypothetical protein